MGIVYVAAPANRSKTIVTFSLIKMFNLPGALIPFNFANDFLPCCGILMTTKANVDAKT